MSEIVSRVYKPDSQQCCEACVFGSGEHAAWCINGSPLRPFDLAPLCSIPGCTRPMRDFALGLCAYHNCRVPYYSSWWETGTR